MNTHITVIIDESGSMFGNIKNVQDGFRTLLKDQKVAPGNATMSIVKFNDTANTLLESTDILNVQPMIINSYRPRGSTALYDAIGMSVTELSAEISLGNVNPDKILFVIMTDGAENRSTEFKSKDIQALVKNRKDKGWEFMFIGADEDALESQTYDIGLTKDLAFSADYASASGVADTYTRMSGTITQYRGGKNLKCAIKDTEEVKEITE